MKDGVREVRKYQNVVEGVGGAPKGESRQVQLVPIFGEKDKKVFGDP